MQWLDLASTARVCQGQAWVIEVHSEPPFYKIDNAPINDITNSLNLLTIFAWGTWLIYQESAIFNNTKRNNSGWLLE